MIHQYLDPYEKPTEKGKSIIPAFDLYRDEVGDESGMKKDINNQFTPLTKVLQINLPEVTSTMMKILHIPLLIEYTKTAIEIKNTNIQT